MKIDVKTEILDYDEQPIPLAEGSETNLTVGNMIINALNYITEEDKLSAEEKVHRAVVSQDVYRALKKDDGSTDITQEDIVLVKKLMGELYNPLPLMRAFEILDPKPTAVNKEAV